MTQEQHHPTAEEITFATLRNWAERTIVITAEADSKSASGGFRRAARDVLAILNMNGASPDEPVVFGAEEEP